jgi:hypothetical protein
MKQLLKLNIGRDIHNLLGKLPRDLKQTFDEIYRSVEDQLGSAPAIASRAIRWVMCAERPLAASQLVAAARLDVDDESMTNSGVTIDTVLQACQNLLVVDKELHMCGFAHLSVHEYYETHVWTPSEANACIAKVCLRVLNDLAWLSPAFYTACKEAALAGRPFIGDATVKHVDPDFMSLVDCVDQYWPQFVHKADRSDLDEQLDSLVRHFVGSPRASSPAFQSWCERGTRDVEQFHLSCHWEID